MQGNPRHEQCRILLPGRAAGELHAVLHALRFTRCALHAMRCAVPCCPQVFEFQPDPGLQSIAFERPDLLEAFRDLGESS